MSKMLIEMDSDLDYVSVSIPDEGGGSSIKKPISLQDFTSCVNSEFCFSTGLLPRNTRFFSGSPMKFSIGIETPPMIREIKYKSNNSTFVEKFIVPLPPTLIVFRVNESEVVDTKIVALEKPIFSINDSVFRFPFGNTHNTGGVCWGHVDLPSVNNMFALSVCISMFFESEYNGDLFDSYTIHGMDPNTDYRSNLVKLLGDLRNLKTFPVDRLYQIQNKAIKDFMNESK